ncbi:hypothetical protein WICPIJ_005270 [Wickerhamomyces pijperi]|uniref:SYO1-like TPR repeats domain-containing protein n=1 Tax=Wickerhamomyces pijperi TaxID=599730 RepID=A0A9P8TMI2_WICPI|nr:hypothetical protein WICPIJ_005270 [Wickerhamomyces pijperi]
MGKLKKRSRSSKYRSNPVNRAASSSEQTKQDDNLRTSKIIPVIAKLQSAIPNDRSTAISTIAVMLEDTKFRKLLLKEKLVQIILDQCLTDSNIEIVVESFGLLRNLVIEEGYDVSTYLWRQNIWVVIEKNLQKAMASFAQYTADQKQFKKGEVTILFDFLENLVSLTFGLTDSSDEILTAVLAKTDLLFGCIKTIFEYAVKVEQNQLLISTNLFNTILELIYNLASSSNEFISNFQTQWSDFPLEQLTQFIFMNIKTNELSRVLIQGISLQVTPLTNALISNIFTSIIATIQDIDVAKERSKLSHTIDNANVDQINKSLKEKIDTRSKFQAIDISIEMITAIIEMIASEMQFNKSTQLEINDSLINLFVSVIPEILLKLSQFDEFKDRSLTGLNNLNWFFITLGDYEDETWLAKNKEIFSTVSGYLTAATVPLDVEIKISIFGTLWSSLVMFASHLTVSDELLQGTLAEFNSLDKQEQTLSEDEEEYLIRIIGFLGNLAKVQGQVERNAVVAGLFFDMLTCENAKLVKAKLTIIDLLFEIYGDASFDYDSVVFVQGGLLNKLKLVKLLLRKELKLVDKNTNRQLKKMGEEVMDNLDGFIQYKEQEGK